MVVPYLEIDLPASGLDLNKPWNDIGGNNLIATDRIDVWVCPRLGQPGSGMPLPTAYVGIAGVGTDAPLLPKSDRAPVSSATTGRQQWPISRMELRTRC